MSLWNPLKKVETIEQKMPGLQLSSNQFRLICFAKKETILNQIEITVLKEINRINSNTSFPSRYQLNTTFS